MQRCCVSHVVLVSDLILFASHVFLVLALSLVWGMSRVGRERGRESLVFCLVNAGKRLNLWARPDVFHVGNRKSNRYSDAEADISFKRSFLMALTAGLSCERCSLTCCGPRMCSCAMRQRERCNIWHCSWNAMEKQAKNIKGSGWNLAILYAWQCWGGNK